MNQMWVSMVLPYLAAVALLVVPGLVVIIAGWGWRRIELMLLAPAVSLSLIAVSSVLAPLVGMGWTILAVIALTAIAAAAILGLRRWAGPPPEAKPRWNPWAVGIIALSGAAILIGAQLVWAFGSPENIAQRFDNIVHLNAVRYALDTANASAFNIGATSDIGFYPNGWHSFTTLVIQITGLDIPSGVNVANIAIASLLWPASAMAFGSTFIGVRAVTLVGSAALSTAFGAFPALFFNWGVLYPNVVGYSMLPAVLAAVTLVLKTTSTATRVQSVVLLLMLTSGAFLGHPTSVLAAIAMGGGYAVAILTSRAVSLRSWRHAATAIWTTLGVGALAIVAWMIARTGAEHSGWTPWQTAPQALGEAALVLVRGYPATLIAVSLIVVGAVVAIRHPKWIPAAIPFAVAVLFFVVSSGLRIDHPLRQILTNPWYNDSNRLAALLPVAVIPVAVLGLTAIADAVSWGARRIGGERRWPKAVAWTTGIALLVSMAAGANVVTALAQVKEAYTATADSLLLSIDERALLERLPQTTPKDAVIAGSPRTGTSLAYALAGRQVLEKHVFGTRSPDDAYLSSHLRDIQTDPAVCSAVRDTGATFVLDFGHRDVIDNAEAASSYDGIQDLTPSSRLVLVDAEGPDARLFRIEGC